MVVKKIGYQQKNYNNNLSIKYSIMADNHDKDDS
jgi:hypothetical protein